ncbi:UNVERIFIED_CONTAM: hypothetical protein PYX00_005450 [Menopon gallinae]|uniref:HECT domain-containing protein n=1 Tax=Menopon gallinae TaxID=328185 RepID=A0AAW2HRI8_9NEOP
MFCWGSTVHGELGLGGIEQEHVLAPKEHNFKYANSVVQVACGVNHTVMITRSGEVYSCGNNDYGQLGHNKNRTKPEKIEGLEAYRICRVSCGANHTLAFNEWGQLFGWGSDAQGQIGSNGESQLSPRIVKSLAMFHIIQISCGQSHSLALTNGGELYSWGGNSHGQLGLGSRVPYELQPVLVKSLVGIPIAFIACGANHSFAVSKSGAIYGWGKNDYGQLGLNDEVDRLYPTQLKTLRSIRVKYIACGEDFSAFLSADGGVFTCGAGQYGQLGHGSTSNEILPRKVMELMGSTVTQISCGRRHTLALVPSRGRVYAFGLGGAGQLGTRMNSNSTTPQVVMGPWVSPSGVSVITEKKKVENVLVTNIYSGGDQCFVSVVPYKANIAPDDNRVFKEKTQILSIKPDKISQCRKIKANSTVDQELFLYLEIVFRSQSCINSSFLLSNEEHYCCTPKHHGIDIIKAENVFSEIARIENQSITDVIWDGIVEHLIPSLSSSPLDMETLRCYLILPLYHQFENPKNYNKLQAAFGRKVLSLKSDALRIVELWWSRASFEYFERLVRIYKDVVAFLLRAAKRENSFTSDSMVIALDSLALLNKLNHSVENLKVPYDTFYLPELTDVVDVRTDYMEWAADDSPPRWKLFFCNYPFLFDAQAKTSLLQADQFLQMQKAMSEAASRLITRLLFAPSLDVTEDQFLQLHVTRENIVQNTLDQLPLHSSSDLKKPLRVKFIGEEAEDAGGVRKEFFMLVLREVLDPKYGMFKNYEETRTIWFSEITFEDELMYFLIGLLCGLAIYNFTIIDLPFPLALYKKLLHEKVGLMDLKGLSPSHAKSLQDVLDYKEPDLTEVFNLTFEVTRDVFGELKAFPLKENGDKILVTQENKKEFVDLYVDFILNKSVQQHFNAFHDGFHRVCGGKVLNLFHPHELMTLVVGNENYDWDEFERNAEYKNGYTKNDPTIKLFWKVFHELPLEEKKNFLLFLTGSDRIPIQGIKAIKIYIQPTSDDKYLPVAHTCFNLLDLPRYATKERLKYKLCQAIKQNQGFSLV